MTDGRPIGQLFSRVYIEQNAPTRAFSGRARSRLLALFSACARGNEFVSLAATEIGYRIKHLGMAYAYQAAFDEAPDRDLLNMLTLVWRSATTPDRRKWVNNVNRIFREENIQFMMDEKGGVHPFEDEIFDAQRQTTLKHLADPRYESVLVKYEQAYAALLQTPPNTGDCLDKIFEALEAFMKLVDEGNRFSRLDARALNDVIQPFCLQHLTPGSKEAAVAGQMVEGMKKFVLPLHPYRHGQEKTPRPPMQLTIACLGICTAFLRYLLEVDQLAAAAYCHS